MAEHTQSWCARCQEINALGNGCECCGRPIVGIAYRSCRVDHVHDDEAGKAMLQLPVMLRLCRDCYLNDFAAAYPGESLPDLGEAGVVTVAPSVLPPAHLAPPPAAPLALGGVITTGVF